MTPAQVDRLVDDACRGRAVIAGRRTARRYAAILTRHRRAAGDDRPVRAYACPFEHRGSYHVGPAPSMATVEQLAGALRHLHAAA